jgi:hypothetical protein
LIEVWRKLRQWIFDAGVAFGLVPVGTVNDVQLSLEVDYPNDQLTIYRDAVRINLIQGRIGFIGATITSMSAQDSAPASNWGYLLGLFQESAASFAFTFSGGVWRLDGQFQPRFISVLLRSEQDSGEYEERQDYRTVTLGSGRVIAHNYGFAAVYRDLRLVSLHPFELAPQYHIGSMLSIDITRTRVNFPNPDTDGAGGSGVLGLSLSGTVRPSFMGDKIAAGDMVRVAEQWVSRVRSVTIPAPPAPAEILFWEQIPTNIAPVAGAPIYKISEVHAFVLESLRLQGLFVYDVDDTSGLWRPSGPLYQLRGAGKLLLRFDRQTPQASDRFSFGLDLVRASDPQLQVLS